MKSDAPNRPRTWRVGPFELDVGARELARNGERVRLQDQPFEILCALLERAGEVVTREELCARLWPDGTFVDFEHSLNAAVKRLRNVLGDDALAPTFIETVPRRGYRLRKQTEEATRPPASPGASRIAVLPFADLSELRGHSSFGDGLAEETMAQLGTICRGRIGVISRRSTLGFKDTADSARAIGELLRAQYLLEGSVRRDEGRVRVTARLVDAAEETLLWSHIYDRAAASLLELQTDIATRIAHAVAGELATARAAEDPSPDSDAYRAFLKGQYYWQKPGDTGLDQALDYYAEGLKLAPTFAAAHAARARGLVSRAEYYRERPREALVRARDAARRALEYNARQAEAHLTLGDVTWMLDFDWDAARASYGNALALNPAYEGGHRSYALLLSALGLHDEAREAADRAAYLDPGCLMAGATRAWVRYAAGGYAPAIDHCLHTLDLDPGYVPARRLLGAAYLQAARRVECDETFAAAVREHPDDPVVLAWAAHAHAVQGRPHHAQNLLAHLDALADDRYVPPLHRALACTGLGRLDEAFALLEVAYEDRDPMFATVAADPRFAPLRTNSRYERVRRQANLEVTPS